MRKKKLIMATCAALSTVGVVAVPVCAEAVSLTFEPNGGEWIGQKFSMDIFGVRVLENNSPHMKRSNYYLSGYTTKPDGKGDYYYFGETVALYPNETWVNKFPSTATKVYAKWKQYKTTKTVNLSEYKFTQFTNSSLNGKGYVPQGGEVYKKNGKMYFVASWYDQGKKSNDVKLVKYEYDGKNKTAGIASTSGKMYHANGVAYGDGTIYVASGIDENKNKVKNPGNMVFKLNESSLSNKGQVNFNNNCWEDTCQAVAYKDGKLFAEFSNGRIIIFDTKTNKIEKEFYAEGLLVNEAYNLVQGMAVNGNKIYVLAFRKDSNGKVVVGDQRIFVYDYTASKGNWKKEEWKIVDKNDEIEDISFVDGKMYLIRGGDHNCGVYDLSSKIAKKTGWKNENGKVRFYGKDGKAYTGWKKMGAAEGETIPHWSYFGDDGAIRLGWQQMGKGTKNPDGNTAKHISYFGDNGWLRTGWQQMGKGTKNPDGNTEKHISYFGDNGWLRTGWQQMGKGTSNPDGNVAKHFSYFGSNGWLRTGMVTLGKADGEKIIHKSYFGNNGWLVVNKKFSVAGKMYTSDAKGWVR